MSAPDELWINPRDLVSFEQSIMVFTEPDEARADIRYIRAPDSAEFCKHCGAGIGKFRRYGEGTCPECDPQWAEHQVRVSPAEEAAVEAALAPESADRTWPLPDARRELTDDELQVLRRVTVRKPTVWERRAFAAGVAHAIEQLPRYAER